jgi:hypothetical protein
MIKEIGRVAVETKNTAFVGPDNSSKTLPN